MSVQMMDDRFMLNQEPVEDAVEALSQAKVVVYTTMGATESRRRYGVTGQSIVDALPQAVWVDGLGMHNVDTAELVPVRCSGGAPTDGLRHPEKKDGTTRHKEPPSRLKSRVKPRMRSKAV